MYYVRCRTARRSSFTACLSTTRTRSKTSSRRPSGTTPSVCHVAVRGRYTRPRHAIVSARCPVGLRRGCLGLGEVATSCGSASLLSLLSLSGWVAPLHHILSLPLAPEPTSARALTPFRCRTQTFTIDSPSAQQLQQARPMLQLLSTFSPPVVGVRVPGQPLSPAGVTSPPPAAASPLPCAIQLTARAVCPLPSPRTIAQRWRNTKPRGKLAWPHANPRREHREAGRRRCGRSTAPSPTSKAAAVPVRVQVPPRASYLFTISRSTSTKGSRRNRPTSNGRQPCRPPSRTHRPKPSRIRRRTRIWHTPCRKPRPPTSGLACPRGRIRWVLGFAVRPTRSVRS